MKISALLTVAVSGQDYASDKWSFDDYSLDGKVKEIKFKNSAWTLTCTFLRAKYFEL